MPFITYGKSALQRSRRDYALLTKWEKNLELIVFNYSSRSVERVSDANVSVFYNFKGMLIIVIMIIPQKAQTMKLGELNKTVRF
jgi:hypothetical protein